MSEVRPGDRVDRGPVPSEESHTCFTYFCPRSVVWEARTFSKPSCPSSVPSPRAPCGPGTGCSTVRPQEKVFPLKPQVFLPGSALSAQHPPPPAGDPAVPLAHHSPRWRPPVPASAPPEESLQTPTCIFLPPQQPLWVCNENLLWGRLFQNLAPGFPFGRMGTTPWRRW